VHHPFLRFPSLGRASVRLSAAGLILALLASSAAPARAEDDPDTAPDAAGITFVDGWAAGKAQAKASGKLVFLYFGRHTPT
jgi:hypothetical protein